MSAYIGRHAGRHGVHDGQHPPADCWPCTVRLAYRPKHTWRTP
ncbi:MAG: hypothetical protein ACRD0W_05805 [Acidimicrobiales bacterium]